MRRARVTLASLIAAVVAVVVVLERGWWAPVDPARYPIWGVDVSHHQGAIDWVTVARQPHLAFAYLKATEGGSFVDARFAENWKGARAAGLRVGAYHFFSFCSPAEDQAARFLGTALIDADALPPAVDLELGGNCARVPSAAEVQRELARWLAIVARGTGRKPVVYATQEAFDRFLCGADLGAPIWIRSLWRAPDPPFVLWQFLARGRVRGVGGPVDLDAFAGDRVAFAHWR